jgi:hypothetical protein
VVLSLRLRPLSALSRWLRHRLVRVVPALPRPSFVPPHCLHCVGKPGFFGAAFLLRVAARKDSWGIGVGVQIGFTRGGAFDWKAGRRPKISRIRIQQRVPFHRLDINRATSEDWGRADACLSPYVLAVPSPSQGHAFKAGLACAMSSVASVPHNPSPRIR